MSIPSFAEFAGRRPQPYTSWGDFIRLALRSGQLDAVRSVRDLERLVDSERLTIRSEAGPEWRRYRTWLRTKGFDSPDQVETDKPEQEPQP